MRRNYASSISNHCRFKSNSWQCLRKSQTIECRQKLPKPAFLIFAAENKRAKMFMSSYKKDDCLHPHYNENKFGFGVSLKTLIETLLLYRCGLVKGVLRWAWTWVQNQSYFNNGLKTKLKLSIRPPGVTLAMHSSTTLWTREPCERSLKVHFNFQLFALCALLHVNGSWEKCVVKLEGDMLPTQGKTQWLVS